MKVLKNKTSKLLLLLILLGGALVKQSCKKIDHSKIALKSKTAIEEKFFSGTQNSSETTKRVISKFKELNETDDNYIVHFVEKYGYPRWDKTQITNPNTSNRNTNDEATDLLIPVVVDETTNVKTCIKAAITQAVTTIGTYELGYYQNLAFGNNVSKINAAEKWVIEFMLQTKYVFGTNEFKILDKRLFYDKAIYDDPINRSTYIKFLPNSSDPLGRTFCTTTTTYDFIINCNGLGFICNLNSSPPVCDLCPACGSVVVNTVTDCGNGGNGPGGTGGTTGTGYGNGNGFTGYTGGGSGSGTGTGGTGTGVTLPWVAEEDNYAMFDDLGNPLDDTYRMQCSIIRQWKNVIANETGPIGNKRKGNFGEIASDTAMQKKGYTPLHNRITNIDRPLQDGIDGIFKKGNIYYIIESKYANSTLNQTTSDGPQMSSTWILGSNRILNAVKGDTALANAIKLNYKPYIVRVFPNGLVEYHTIDAAGVESSTVTPFPL